MPKRKFSLAREAVLGLGLEERLGKATVISTEHFLCVRPTLNTSTHEYFFQHSLLHMGKSMHGDLREIVQGLIALKGKAGT